MYKVQRVELTATNHQSSEEQVWGLKPRTTWSQVQCPSAPVPQCPSAQLYSGEPIYCHIAMFNLILCFILRVEDAEGCFILTDRYADDREAAVSWNEDHEWSITVLLFLSNLLAS